MKLSPSVRVAIILELKPGIKNSILSSVYLFIYVINFLFIMIF